MFDGKTSRPTWKIDDGNGDPNPGLVEKNRNRKTGHPTWKLYTRNVPNPIQKGADEPPLYVYLDDRAAYDILQQSSVYNAHERHRNWPFDFDSQGKIPASRPNRGRPVYEPGSNSSFVALTKRGGGQYWLCGALPAPPAPSSSKASSSKASSVSDNGFLGGNNRSSPTESHTGISASVNHAKDTSLLSNGEINHEADDVQQSSDQDIPCLSIEMEQSQPKNGTQAPTVKEEDAVSEQPSDPPLADKKKRRKASLQTSAAETQHRRASKTLPSPVAHNPLNKSPEQLLHATAEPEDQPANDISGSRSPVFPVTHAHKAPTPCGAFSSPPPVDTNLQHHDADTPMGGVPLPLQSEVSINNVKRNGTSSANSENLSHAPKRLRKSIQPYAPPPSVLVYEDENTRLKSENEQLRKALKEAKAEYEANVCNLDDQHANKQRALQARLDTIVSERNAFRTLAQSLYAHKVDLQNELADRHNALTNLLDGLDSQRADLDKLAVRSRRELKPTAALHRNVEEVLDEQGEKFQRTGLKDAWKDFLSEAMEF
ncbi:uncharacterized protein K452DRAFT_302947 [Aplosporella prunicola CBS 121167]|uniref:Uncharacterized protein n=1 Tax=Aplosporella prunicola CBS 121167 TaxID=1176127 RepID=A0A6A6AZ35_9PEZI|nr:uncharacterized protein K452DRAFT_302947 [Aplosporella prunicola CBS 121167]KAF2136215.1 hypothetical protein K452DRAFT_302947 [Aplosporella prunicola CBS 121167]